MPEVLSTARGLKRRQEADEARVVGSYAPPSFSPMFIIKRQIQSVIKFVAVVFNFSVFACLTKKPLPDVQVVLCFLTVFHSLG